MSLIEVTVDDLIDSTSAINTQGGPFRTLVVRVLDHKDDVPEATDTNDMAIFKSVGLGQPWKKANHYSTHKIYSDGLVNKEEANEALIIFPDFDYSDGYIGEWVNSWIHPDGSLNCNGIIYCNQPVNCDK